MDELEKIKIYAQMLLEVVNQAEIKRYQEKKDAANAKEQQMLIDLSGISVNSKPRTDGRYQGYYTIDGKKHYVYGKSESEIKTKIEFFLKHGAPKKKPAKKKRSVLLPVMCGAASAAGALSGAGSLYMGSSLFFSLLTSLIRALLLPLVYAYLGLAAVECGLPDERLGSVRTLLGWCISALLKGVMYVFTAYLSLTGLLSGSSDEAAVNAAKSTLSAALPVVGGIAADASEAVLQSAKLLRATAGTFGILAVLAMALVPFLKIAICYLTMKLTAAAAGLASGKEHAALLGAQTSAMGYLLSMVGCAALLLLFSTCCFMKVAAG